MNDNCLRAFGQMTYGIYVLTTRFGEEVNGMISSWAVQVSYEPPLVMVAVHPNRYTVRLIQGSGHFALHMVDYTQKENKPYLRQLQDDERVVPGAQSRRAEAN